MSIPYVFIHAFLTSVVFTCIIETCILLFLLRFIIRDIFLQTWRVVFAGLFASFATIGYVWFVFPPMVAEYLGNVPPDLLSEPFAFAVEAVFYRMVLRLKWRNAFLVSFICNAASYALGPLLRANGLWPEW